MPTNPTTTGERFERPVGIMARLRAPDGCPWDREQSFDTIKPYLLEETYKVLKAIDNRDLPGLADEPGDLMLLRCSKRCQKDRVWRTPARSRSGLPTTHCAAHQIRFWCRHGAPRGAKCYRDNCWIREAPTSFHAWQEFQGGAG